MASGPEDDEQAPESPRERASARASRPPSRPPLPPRPSAPHFGLVDGLRVLFAALWIGVQVALILTAGRRADGAFGFRMFSESSTVKISLYREIAGEDGTRARVHVDDGTWTARDAAGMKRRFAWTDRIRKRDLAIFDTEISAGYGAATQLGRLQAALDDVASHTPDDVETRRFLLDVAVRHNGREAYVVHLASPERGGR
ncbi:MAG: hypothetical protein KF819_30360 [Labilithrix sp.]|nr:hypothetical protein [Labilithrix sp.]